MVFLVLFCIPLLLMIGVHFFLHEFTWWEALIQVGVQAVVAGLSILVVYYATVGDVEVWNGYVKSKERDTVSCQHSYSCNCRESCSGSGNNRSCSTTCDTCYEHHNDYDWNAYTSNNETITIDRVDKQGTQEPLRWSIIKIGEPTVVSHRYTSYIKGSPDTLFRKQGLMDKYKGTIPAYPEVFDYYKMRRFISLGVEDQNNSAWNEGLNQVNAELGFKKQVNTLVVLTKQPQDWFYALEEAWVGGKKNDVVLVIGTEENRPIWVSVMAWTDRDEFKIKLRDSIMDLKSIDHELVLPILKREVDSGFVRKPMADFEYLKASITPSQTQWIISLIIGILCAGATTFLIHKNRRLKHNSSYTTSTKSKYRFYNR